MRSLRRFEPRRGEAADIPAFRRCGYEAIHRRYEEERSGLGDEFLVEAGRTVEAVLNLPEAYPTLHRDTRRALIRRFPYGLLYRTVGDTIVFVGCFHTSRDPLSWKERK
jgi:toxin ParE1/3/4